MRAKTFVPHLCWLGGLLAMPLWAQQNAPATQSNQVNQAGAAKPDPTLTTDAVPTIELKNAPKRFGALSGLMDMFSAAKSTAQSAKSAAGRMKDSAKNDPLNQKPKDKGEYHGQKVRRMFIRHQSGFVEKFNIITDFKNPPAHTDEVYYYDKKSQKIVMRNPFEFPLSKFDKENWLLLHGPYVKQKDGQLYEQGDFYLGAKHGRWEKFDKNFILTEKHYFSKGLARDVQIVYHDQKKGRVKEVIPTQYGLRHGTYVAYYPSGRVAERGKYMEGEKVGRWREYYDQDRYSRKKEIIYPKRAYTGEASYVSKEWDEKGKVLVDVRK